MKGKEDTLLGSFELYQLGRSRKELLKHGTLVHNNQRSQEGYGISYTIDCISCINLVFVEISAGQMPEYFKQQKIPMLAAFAAVQIEGSK